jgi:hypothetical protein
VIFPANVHVPFIGAALFPQLKHEEREEHVAHPEGQLLH